MRIVFMGTPDFAVPSLERLLRDGHEVALVVTQADKPPTPRGITRASSSFFPSIFIPFHL